MSKCWLCNGNTSTNIEQNRDLVHSADSAETALDDARKLVASLSPFPLCSSAERFKERLEGHSKNF